PKQEEVMVMKKLLLTFMLVLSLLIGTAFAESPVIVPGERVGNFRLGMTRQEVLKMAPNPQENSPDMIKYLNYSTGNRLHLSIKNNQVESIAFTNKSWSTAAGVSLSNYLNNEVSHLISCGMTLDKTLLVCKYISDGLEFDMRISDATEFGLVMP